MKKIICKNIKIIKYFAALIVLNSMRHLVAKIIINLKEKLYSILKEYFVVNNVI